MIKKLDLYIIKKFLGTFFFSIILIVTIAIVFDLSEKLDDFMEKQVPAKEIFFGYYMNFAPYFANLFMFLFVFISVIFFTSKMANRSEIIAILSAGISFKRLLVPYFVSAGFLALLSLLLSNFIIPNATENRLKFENTYINGTYYNSDRNIHKQISPGVFIYLENYNTVTDMGYKFSIEKFENNKLVSKLMSELIQWDSIKSKWKVHNYYIRTYGDSIHNIEYGTLTDTSLTIYPADFKERATTVETLNYFELNDFIDSQILHGNANINSYLIEKHGRLAYPFATFILTLIGVSVSSRKVRGGTGMTIGIGLLLSFSFILFMQIAKQFSINGNFPPLLSVWLPNIIYFFIAIFVYKLAPK